MKDMIIDCFAGGGGKISQRAFEKFKGLLDERSYEE